MSIPINITYNTNINYYVLRYTCSVERVVQCQGTENWVAIATYLASVMQHCCKTVISMFIAVWHRVILYFIYWFKYKRTLYITNDILINNYLLSAILKWNGINLTIIHLYIHRLNLTLIIYITSLCLHINV